MCERWTVNHGRCTNRKIQADRILALIWDATEGSHAQAGNRKYQIAKCEEEFSPPEHPSATNENGVQVLRYISEGWTILGWLNRLYDRRLINHIDRLNADVRSLMNKVDQHQRQSLAAYRFCFGQSPVSKLVPATSLLWVLQKFRVYDYDFEWEMSRGTESKKQIHPTTQKYMLAYLCRWTATILGLKLETTEWILFANSFSIHSDI